MPSAYDVPFLETIKLRRSTLALAKSSPISDKRIVHLVRHSIKYVPSPFHVQSCRAIVLFGVEHDRLWDLARVRAKEQMDEETWKRIEGKIAEYKGAYGTVSCLGGMSNAIGLLTLEFFEDTEAVKKFPPFLQDLITQFPECKPRSPLLVFSVLISYQVFEIYNSKAQTQARTHPNIIKTQKFLLSLWHTSESTGEPVPTKTPIPTMLTVLPLQERRKRPSPSTGAERPNGMNRFIVWTALPEDD